MTSSDPLAALRAEPEQQLADLCGEIEDLFDDRVDQEDIAEDEADSLFQDVRLTIRLHVHMWHRISAKAPEEPTTK